MADGGQDSDSDSDLWTNIWYEDHVNNTAGVIELFNSITTKDLNNTTITDPNYTLLHMLIKEFDPQNKYPELVNGIFRLRHVDPQIVNIDKRNPRTGATALMLAANRGNLELVNVLVAWKANPHVLSNTLMTAFTYACTNGHVEVARYLSEYVTREELEVEQTHSGITVKTEVEQKLREFPNLTQYDTLLNIIHDIEVRHLVEERT